MEQFPVPNRQRRKSNLGRRNRTSENPPRLEPVFPVPVPRGLGRSAVSTKKTHSIVNVQKSSVEKLCAKKQLFRLSPQNFLPSFPQQKRDETPKAIEDSQINLRKFASNLSLNETGFHALVTTPSPNDKSNTIPTQALEKHSSHNKIERPKSPIMSQYKQLIERPKSPGISQYNQFLFTDLANLKPPVDPDENLEQITSPSHKQSTQNLETSKIELNSQCSSTKKEKISPYSSMLNNDELDTTGSFIFAEQTIIDQNQTLIESESPRVKETGSVPESTLKLFKNLEPVMEEENEPDSEDEILQKTLSKLNMMMVEIENTKKLVYSLIRKKSKRKTNDENKENCTLLANKPNKNKWMSEIKSVNPSLLKTPKALNKLRLSFAEQSTIWTPHSLSTVLSDQMDDLFE